VAPPVWRVDGRELLQIRQAAQSAAAGFDEDNLMAALVTRSRPGGCQSESEIPDADRLEHLDAPQAR
jgi:hypothetical protein